METIRRGSAWAGGSRLGTGEGSSREGPAAGNGREVPGKFPLLFSKLRRPLDAEGKQGGGGNPGTVVGAVECDAAEELGRLFDEEISEDQAIHLAAGERAVGIRRRGHNRFAAQVKRSVEHHGNARGLPEALD